MDFVQILATGNYYILEGNTFQIDDFLFMQLLEMGGRISTKSCVLTLYNIGTLTD